MQNIKQNKMLPDIVVGITEMCGAGVLCGSNENTKWDHNHSNESI